MFSKATANRFMVSNEFGREFHSVKIIFSVRRSIATNSLPSIKRVWYGIPFCKDYIFCTVFNCNKFATINFRFCFTFL